MTCQASMELTEELVGNDKTVLDVCLMLHMSNTGSADPLTLEDEDKSLKLLKMMLSKWADSHVSSKRFDDAVKNLIEATLIETELHRYKFDKYIKEKRKEYET
jgi:hypothetical protein